MSRPTPNTHPPCIIHPSSHPFTYTPAHTPPPPSPPPTIPLTSADTRLYGMHLSCGMPSPPAPSVPLGYSRQPGAASHALPCAGDPGTLFQHLRAAREDRASGHVAVARSRSTCGSWSSAHVPRGEVALAGYQWQLGSWWQDFSSAAARQVYDSRAYCFSILAGERRVVQASRASDRAVC